MYGQGKLPAAYAGTARGGVKGADAHAQILPGTGMTGEITEPRTAGPASARKLTLPAHAACAAFPATCARAQGQRRLEGADPLTPALPGAETAQLGNRKWTHEFRGRFSASFPGAARPSASVGGGFRSFRKRKSRQSAAAASVESRLRPEAGLGPGRVEHVYGTVRATSGLSVSTKTQALPGSRAGFLCTPEVTSYYATSGFPVRTRLFFPWLLSGLPELRFFFFNYLIYSRFFSGNRDFSSGARSGLCLTRVRLPPRSEAGVPACPAPWSLTRGRGREFSQSLTVTRILFGFQSKLETKFTAAWTQLLSVSCSFGDGNGARPRVCSSGAATLVPAVNISRCSRAVWPS